MKTRTIRELWHIAKVVYRELIFRSLLIQNVGIVNDKEAVEKVIKKAGTYSLLKIFLALPIAVFAFEASFITASKVPSSNLTGLLESTLSISAFWILSTFILFLVFVLQASIVLSDKLYEPLMTLNLTAEDLSLTVYLTLFKMFDIPLASAVILSLVAFILLTHNILLTILITATTIVSTILTVTMLVMVGSKLSKSIMKPEVKLSRTVAKILLLVGYTFSFSIIYILPGMLIQYIEPLSKMVLSSNPFIRELVLSLPPISFAYVALVVAYTPWMINSILLPLISVIVTTVGILVTARRTLTTVPRSIFSSGLPKEGTRRRFEVSLNPSSSYFGGLMRKEFKILFRNPNTAIVFLFGPIMFVLYFAMYVALDLGRTFLTSTVTMIVPLLFFMAPNLLVAEGEGIAYLFTLPVRTEDILKVKSVIMTLSYIVYVVIALPLMTLYFNNLSTSYYWLIPSTSGFFLAVYHAVKKALDDMLKKNVSFMELRGDLGYILYLAGLLLVFFAVPYFSLILTKFISNFIPDLLVKILFESIPYTLVGFYTIWAVYLLVWK